MSDNKSHNDGDNEAQGKDGSQDGPEGQQATFEPITSQADLDKMISARLARERAKYGDYDALKAKAEQFDNAERDKLDEVERLKADLAAATTARDAAQFESVRASVAASKGVPAASLTGTSREELESAADELIAWRDQNAPKQKKDTKLGPDGFQSGSTKPGDGSNSKAAAAEALRRMRAG